MVIMKGMQKSKYSIKELIEFKKDYDNRKQYMKEGRSWFGKYNRFEITQRQYHGAFWLDNLTYN